MFKILSIAIFLLSYEYANSAKILASVFSPSYSHQIAFRPLWKELASRGHQITLLTTDPMNDKSLKNIREIDLSGSYQVMESGNASKLLTNKDQKGFRERLDTYINSLSATSAWQFNHTEVQDLLNNEKHQFDLLIVEVMYPSHLALVDHFKVPFIGITSLDAVPRLHKSIGNPTNPIVYPDTVLPFTTGLTFTQRLISTLFSLFTWWYDTYHIFPLEDANVKNFFPNIRPLSEIEKDISMLFVTMNPIFHTVRALGPNTIQIGGGTHLKETKPLPDDIKKFLDAATEGVIYFSLGTNVKSNLLNVVLKSVITQAFTELPYKVLWKFEDDDLDDKPKNVKILKWVPQQDVLKHPNVKLFITQCGLQSIEESIFSSVPMICMPFFGDQSKNARIVEAKQLGRLVDKETLSKPELKETIEEVINNETYKKNVQDAAMLMQDVQMTGLEKAVWWTEYLIRHKDISFMKTNVHNFNSFQYYLLDVILFCVVVTAIGIYVQFKITKFCFRRIFRRNKVKSE